MQKTEKIPIFYDTIEFEVDYLPCIRKRLERYFTYGQFANFRKRGAEVGVVLDFSVTDGEINIYQSDEVLRGTPYEVHSDKNFYEFAPSSHYGINVGVYDKYVNGKKTSFARCHFNFSIPKLVYGHNIALFPKNDDGDDDKLTCLWRFVDWFLKFYFVTDKITANFELKSLHLCYNYRYDNDDSFKKFGDIIHLVYHRLKSHTNMSVYETSVAKTIEGGYIKIYDKSTEFIDSEGGFKALVNYYYKKAKSVGIAKELAKLNAIKDAEKVAEYARNVWRCEIELRPKLINQLFWQDYKTREYSGKELYLKRKQGYDLYMNISRSIKNYLSLRPLNTERKRQSYVKFLQKYGEWIYRDDLNGMMFSKADLAWVEKMDEIRLMKKFIKRLIISNYQDLIKTMNIKPVVSRVQVSGSSSFDKMVLDSLILRRGAEKMANFVYLFTKLAKTANSMDLQTFLMLNKKELVGQKLKYVDSKGNEKERELSVKFINAIIRHCTMTKANILYRDKNKSYYRNEAWCLALERQYGVSHGKQFRVKEIFNFSQKFMLKSFDNSKNNYICPIIDIMLNSILKEILHRTDSQIIKLLTLN